jgi:hypothetical protein
MPVSDTGQKSNRLAALPVLVPLWTAGPVKTVKICKGKWQMVNSNFIPHILNDDQPYYLDQGYI